MQYDALVVGGGIQGAGVAQAAAAAGYRTLVLEMQHLAHGTSSRSSKLVHGGLRYLETGQLSLVAESLRERRYLLANAPGLVKLVPFYVPIYRTSRRRPWWVRSGLTLYSLLGGLREANRFRKLSRLEWAGLDGLRTTDLECVFEYWDGQTNDAALTRAVMRSALELGAELRCPAALVRAEREPDGYRIQYRHDDAIVATSARVVFNAAGPWVSQVLACIQPEPPALTVDFVAGSHVLLEGGLERGVYYTEAPDDHRPVLLMPWEGNTLVGTTERPYDGDPGEVEPTDSEVEYLLRALRHCFPNFDAPEIARFAGLRVLPRGRQGINQRPRETLFHLDRPEAPRLVTVAGGKLTGYRSTAAKAIQLVAASLPAASRRADTRSLRLPLEATPAPGARSPSRSGGGPSPLNRP
ncbi:MAG: glycerol-3-phosphate dehydrogenase/oxidase [Planctomycetota bacterium]